MFGRIHHSPANDAIMARSEELMRQSQQLLDSMPLADAFATHKSDEPFRDQRDSASSGA
jgi:hypothetical protein